MTSDDANIRTRDGLLVTIEKIAAFDFALHMGPTSVKCGGGTFGKADAETLRALAPEVFSFDFAFLCAVARKVARSERLTRESIFAAREAELSESADLPKRLRA